MCLIRCPVDVNKPFKQSGQALMIMLIVIAVGALSIFFTTLNRNSLQIEQDKKTFAVLAQAKEALIGYTVSRVDVGETPGLFPLPDRLVEVPQNYDGTTDTCIGSYSGLRCIGRLPWKTLGMSITAPSEHDSSGAMPWYAFSANLMDVCLEFLNSDLLTLAFTSYACPTSTVLPHPWLTVRDSRGNIISSRVAAVIIVPGPPLASQSRPLPPTLGGPDQYLDSVTVPTSCASPCLPGTYHNYDQDNDFTIGNQSATFNDRLLYITIDDLMPLILKRVVSEIRFRLNQYHTTYGFYPYAANNVSPFDCIQSQTSGSLPLANGNCLDPSLGVVSSFPPWFKYNWMQVVTYERIAPNLAELKINMQTYNISP